MSLEWMTQSACLGQSAVFFPDTYNNRAVTRARTICRTCPVYDSCAAWGQSRYPELPDGILFGYTAPERARMWWGHTRYRDWRNDAEGLSVASLNRRERNALAAGVPALVDAYAIYSIDDPQRRTEVIAAYQAWRDAQALPLSYDEAVDRLQRIREHDPTLKGRARSLPVNLRPPCPQGHGPLHRISQRHTSDLEVWDCFICHTKVRTTLEELIGA